MNIASDSSSEDKTPKIVYIDEPPKEPKKFKFLNKPRWMKKANVQEEDIGDQTIGEILNPTTTTTIADPSSIIEHLGKLEKRVKKLEENQSSVLDTHFKEKVAQCLELEKNIHALTVKMTCYIDQQQIHQKETAIETAKKQKQLNKLMDEVLEKKKAEAAAAAAVVSGCAAANVDEKGEVVVEGVVVVEVGASLVGDEGPKVPKKNMKNRKANRTAGKRR